jgi:hypothetical protein
VDVVLRAQRGCVLQLAQPEPYSSLHRVRTGFLRRAVEVSAVAVVVSAVVQIRCYPDHHVVETVIVARQIGFRAFLPWNRPVPLSWILETCRQMIAQMDCQSGSVGYLVVDPFETVDLWTVAVEGPAAVVETWYRNALVVQTGCVHPGFLHLMEDLLVHCTAAVVADAGFGSVGLPLLERCVQRG